MMHLFPSFKRFCLILLCGIYCNYPFVPSNRTSLSCIFMKLTNIQCLECTLSSHQSLLTSSRPRDTTRARSTNTSLRTTRRNVAQPGQASGDTINSSLRTPHRATAFLPSKQGARIHLNLGNRMGRTSPG